MKNNSCLPDRAWVARCVAEPWLKIYYHAQDLYSVDSRQVKLAKTNHKVARSRPSFAQLTKHRIRTVGKSTTSNFTIYFFAYFPFWFSYSECHKLNLFYIWTPFEADWQYKNYKVKVAFQECCLHLQSLWRHVVGKVYWNKQFREFRESVYMRQTLSKIVIMIWFSYVREVSRGSIDPYPCKSTSACAETFVQSRVIVYKKRSK